MSKNSFFLWTIVWLLQIALVGVLVPSNWLEGQISKERQMTADWLGRDTLLELVKSSDSTFASVFEETGMVAASYSIIPTHQQIDKSTGLETLGGGIWPYVEG